MAALTIQKHDLRQQIAEQMGEYYDLLDAEERRLMITALAYEWGGLLSVSATARLARQVATAHG